MTAGRAGGAISPGGYRTVVMAVEPAPGTVIADGAPALNLAATVRDRLGRTRIWHVNSTGTGGGVVELLRSSIGRHRLLGLPASWLVSNAPGEFFDLTKRVHHALHGRLSGGPFDRRDAELYQVAGERQAEAIADHVNAGDLVVLHDPQLLPAVPGLVATGARVAWRCHIGTRQVSPVTEMAWQMLRPYARRAYRCAFSLPEYVPAFLPAERATVILPSIDPYAAKNREISAETQAGLLQRIALTAGPARDAGQTADAHLGRSVHDRLLPLDADVVLQVSRWDPLKDMIGVLNAFTTWIAPSTAAHLVLAGPDPADIPDDPEGLRVYTEVARARESAPAPIRERIHLVVLSLSDFEANALVVNALQRRATVVGQKSLEEGFGLTVTEAMWKYRPIVAARAGGISAQIDSGREGILIEDPADLEAFGQSAVRLLADRTLADELGRAAHRRTEREFLADRELADTLRLYLAMLDADAPAAPSPKPPEASGDGDRVV
jgi:trehalose synthase